MGSSVELYVHAVWATAKRRRIIDGSWQGELYRVMSARCVGLDCAPRAIGGVADHVHLLARIPATTPVAQLLADVKGASAHAVNHRLAPGSGFRWQTGYFAQSVSPDDVPAVERYICDQSRHHQSDSLLPELEPPLEDE
jgi:REP element-mobilizing transposase RayT